MPAPKSNELLKLRGTYRPGRHAGRPPRVSPLGKPSSWLTVTAQKWWQDHASQLAVNGVGAGDASVVETAAVWYGVWRETLSAIEGGNAEYRTFCKLAMASKAFSAAASKLGIGPTERSRIRSQGQQESKLSEFVKHG